LRVPSTFTSLQTSKCFVQIHTDIEALLLNDPSPVDREFWLYGKRSLSDPTAYSHIPLWCQPSFDRLQPRFVVLSSVVVCSVNYFSISRSLVLDLLSHDSGYKIAINCREVVFMSMSNRARAFVLSSMFMRESEFSSIQCRKRNKIHIATILSIISWLPNTALHH
jgi:hypothetical protein